MKFDFHSDQENNVRKFYSAQSHIITTQHYNEHQQTERLSIAPDYNQILIRIVILATAAAAAVAAAIGFCIEFPSINQR